MQKEYKNLYLMMTKHSPFPANVMPLAGRATHSQKMQKILDISRSIASLVSGESDEMTHRRKLSEYQVVDFKAAKEDRHASRRIHHNYSHFIGAHTAKTVNSHRALNEEEERSDRALESLQQKASSTMVARRKDLYDNHIEKYMASKYDNEELIKQYLSNRQDFIQQACQEIQKEIKQEFPAQRASERKRARKNRSRLPRIEESASHMLQKTVHRNNDATYQQEINQIKKSEQLQLKERRRQQRVFRHRMHSLQAKLIKLKSPQ